MYSEPSVLCQILLDAAIKAGADEADAIALQGDSVSVDVRKGSLEHAERSEGVDIGLRVLVGRRQAVVASSDGRADTIRAMAERAVAMAGEAPEDPFAGLATPEMLARERCAESLLLFDPTPEPESSELMHDALEAEAAALAVSGVTQVESASAAYGAQSIHFAASNGFSGGYRRSGRSISCAAIAKSDDGMERDYDNDSRIFQADLRAPEDVGKVAGLRTVRRVGARKPETGPYPVLFDERIAASLVGHLLAAANGAAVARGSTWLKDALGERILPKTLSLTEDPHRPRATASRPFDAEGLPTARREIVADGVLTGWTLDLASARKLDLPPTGNATRSAGSTPSPGNWNVSLTQGASSREDLIKDMGTGLLVTSLIGATINPNTGDYSRGASGFWVEGGEIAYPVNECTIAGNLRDMLAGMIPANDARSWLSRVVPSLLVSGMTVAGQ